jgi:hypothetical protein
MTPEPPKKSACLCFATSEFKRRCGECLCERGHLRLHAGKDAVAELSEARAIAAELGIQPTTALGKAVDRLTRAAEAQSRGETLYYGQCLDDYPEGVRDALRRS